MKRKKPLKITSRVSSVTNGVVQSIIAHTEPCAAESGRVLEALGIDPDNLTCVYCGVPARHWDHLRPLVAKKRPTGHVNEASNRVPACDECNTSKSGHPWRTWITSSAKGSPQSRGIVDLEQRIVRLEAFEALFASSAKDLEAIVGSDLWNQYWAMRQDIEDRMFVAQKLADLFRDRITAALS